MKDINAVLDRTIEENKPLVDAWLSNKPGAWGALAGKAIVAITRHLGRTLEESEKRLVWQTLWAKLTEKKMFI